MEQPTQHKPCHFWPQQSPINLTQRQSLYAPFPKSFFNFDYRGAPFKGRFDSKEGHKNFVLDQLGPQQRPPLITVGDVQAELVKIHLHTPSEHDVEGQNLGGEIHLIHKIKEPTAGSDHVVLGIFFEESKTPVETKFFNMWASAVAGSKRAGKRDVESELIDPRHLMPKTDNWYRYEGSLTSEPYSETISWLVFVDPVGVESTDFRKLKKNAHQPERPVQNINRRFVIRNFR